MWYFWVLIFGIIVFKSIKYALLIKRLKAAGIFEVDKMTGKEFEIFVEHLLRDHGYKVFRIGKIGDYGADLLISKDKILTTVQVKRWNNKIGVDAIQEVTASKAHYKAQNAMVISSNYFTENAKVLAKDNSVELIDRDSLIKLITGRKSIMEK